MPADASCYERIAILGLGKMGEAIFSGLLRSEDTQLSHAERYTAVVRTQERAEAVKERYGVTCVDTLAALDDPRLVILAVKPQTFPEILDQLAACSWASSALIVSIAAGITTASIEAALPAGARVVRVMPNLGLTVGHGMSGVCKGAHAREEDLEAVCALFSLLGRALVVDEAHMDALCAISGSGPAYVAALVEALVKAGVAEGLSPALAEELAVATVEGTGAVLLSTDLSATELRTNVSSPGGTTLAALDAMESAGYSAAIEAGVHAATARSKELSL